MSERFNNDQLEFASEVFKAISHPIRLRILNILVEEDLINVTSLSESLSLEQPLISHHLGILKRAFIVKSKKEGREVNYFLELKQIKEIMDCVETCFTQH